MRRIKEENKRSHRQNGRKTEIKAEREERRKTWRQKARNTGMQAQRQAGKKIMIKMEESRKKKMKEGRITTERK